MAHAMIDVFHNVLKYDDKLVYIAFHDETFKPYFHAKQMCDLLGYVDHNSALRDHVKKTNIVYLKNIVADYKALYKNVQGTTKYLNVAGINQLILYSKKPEAKQIAEWITDEVMPSILNTGEYKITQIYQNKICYRAIEHQGH
jgi:prophage antirepressor-like protein